MKRLTAGLAAAALAASAAVFGLNEAAFASTSPTCAVTADTPDLVIQDGLSVKGVAWIDCTQQAKFTLTTKLWRNNGHDGSYTSFTKSKTLTGNHIGIDSFHACAAGSRTFQWHTEGIIDWKIYSGSTVIASGSAIDNSSDKDLQCY